MMEDVVADAVVVADVEEEEEEEDEKREVAVLVWVVALEPIKRCI